MDLSTGHLFAGTLAGLVSTVTLYPVELIKTRMQVTDRNVSGKYRSISSGFRSVMSAEGIRGFYRGVTPAVIASSGSWGGYFYFYEIAKKRMSKNNETGQQLGAFHHLLAGTEAGSIMVFIFNPIWLVRTRLSLQESSIQAKTEAIASKNSKHYAGLLDALATIHREEGIKGLYRGLIPALILTSHGSIQFAVYEEMKHKAEKFYGTPENQHPMLSMGMGALSKIIASTITYPYQVIKSRLQQRESGQLVTNSPGSEEAGLASSSNKAPKYNNTLDCAAKIWRNEGFTGFFRGVGPNALKVAPSAAITFVVYEEMMKLFRGRQ